MNETMVFALTANIDLVNEICDYLSLSPGKISVKHFADGEILVEPEETVRGKKVYVVQSTCNPVTERLMELLVCVDALKRASAGSITCIMPYYGYARQDRKARPRQPITAKLVADLLEAAGANRVVTIDLHATQIQGFFNFPTDDLTCIPMMAYHYKHSGIDLSNTVAVIDADYYNAENEGHILLSVINEGNNPIRFKPGDCVCQAIFIPYGVADQGTIETERTGGIGSTSE